MTRLWKQWLEFFVAPLHPLRLAASRIVFFAAMFLLYLDDDFSAWSDVSEVFWMPIPAFHWLQLGVLSRPALSALQLVWKTALALACAGLFTRVSCGTVAILGFYLLGLRHSMGKVHHFDAIVLFVAGVFVFARSTPSCSLDGWFSRRRGNKANLNTFSGEYRWPVRTVQLLLCLIFFASGVSKLRTAGLDWVFSENMSVILLKQHYWTSSEDPAVNWGLAIARHPALYQTLAGLTLILEVCYPLAFVSRKARWVLVPGMMAAQTGIRLLMGPWFPQFLAANVFWVSWEQLRQWGPSPRQNASVLPRR